MMKKWEEGYYLNGNEVGPMGLIGGMMVQRVKRGCTMITI